MKKIVSIFLAVMLVVSATAISASALYSRTDAECLSAKEAVAQYEAENGVTLETRRYYFLMPNGEIGQKAVNGSDYAEPGEFCPSWHNDFNAEGPAVYWWDAKGCPNPSGWVGYGVEKEEGTDNVYYVDAPVAVTTIIWNNGVDGGEDATLEIYYNAAQTVNIGSEYYDPGESALYPNGTDGTFDGMIYIVDPDKASINELSGMPTIGGEWHYYYGNECYGIVKDGDPDHDCKNEAHWVDGVHVGAAKEEPTEAPTEAPVPTEAPTEAPVPTEAPTEAPVPTEAPTEAPVPIEEPTEAPTEAPAPTEPATEAPAPTEPVETNLRGDADMDGALTIQDVTTIQKYIVELIGEDEISLSMADATADGRLNILDATRIQRVLAGICDINGVKL